MNPSWRTMDISQLDQIPYLRFRELFASLDIPELDLIRGRYRGAFIGPVWIRVSVKPALWVTGLSGWWGKELYKDGRAINILLRRGKFSTRFRMKFIQARSAIDGNAGLSMRYLPDNPLLWIFIVDEIRRLDDSTLLGLTRPRIPGLRWFVLPFVLQKEKS